MRTARIVVSTAAALALGGALFARLPPADAADDPDFVRDVQPILAGQCVRCHSAALPQGGLRLDTREGFLKGGVGGPVVVGHDAAAELLLCAPRRTRIPMKRMPWMSEPLKPAEIATLKRWIEAGASWPAGVTVGHDGTRGRRASPCARGKPRRAIARTSSSTATCARSWPPTATPATAPTGTTARPGLRLDREAAAKAPLASGTVAVVAGAPEKSGLLSRILDPDESRRMPHVSSGKERLKPEQVATLRRWIEEGAEWEPHWSYIPPTRPAPPAVKQGTWPRNEVDAFVLAGIEAQGLAPSAEAPRAERLRRLTFDLTGLPPTPEEMRLFDEDRAAGAWERQVDRLLASPRFGERMAAFWLDLVRYADSVGYHSDNSRPMWRYRDWVVQAFNRNLPFDRFTAEQLAGDLMEGATLRAEDRLRLQPAPPDHRGGRRPAQGVPRDLPGRPRSATRPRSGWAAPWAARSATTTSSTPTWPGTSRASARSSPTSPRPPWAGAAPNYLPDAAQRPRLDAADAEIKRLREALEAASPERAAAQAGWEKTVAAARIPRFTTLEPVESTTAQGTRAMIQGNDFSIIASTSHGPKPPRDTYTVRYKTELKGITALRLEALTFEELPKGGPGRDPEGGFEVTEIEVRDAAGKPLALRNATSSVGPVPGVIDGRTDAGGFALTVANGEDHRLVVELAEPLGSGEETTFTLVLHQNAGGLKTLGRFKLSGSTDARPVTTAPGPEPSAEIKTIAPSAPAERTPEQAQAIARFWRRRRPSSRGSAGAAGGRAAQAGPARRPCPRRS